MLTDKQKKFILYLLRQSGYAESTDWVACLSKKAAGRKIEELLAAKQAAKIAWAEEKKRYQAQLALPPPDPIPFDDPLIPPEIREFKRWARNEYQNGQSILHRRFIASVSEIRFNRVTICARLR